MFLQGLGILRYLDYRPQFNKEACIRKISRKSSCDSCKIACQRKAIKVVKGGIEIDDDCNQCGQCVVSCPTNAISDNNLSFASTNNKVYVICNKSVQNESVDSKITVHCLKKINLKVLFNLYDRGITTIVTNIDACENCQDNNYLKETINKMNHILDITERKKMNIEIIEIQDFDKIINEIKKDKSNKVVERRDFFKVMIKDSIEQVRAVAPPTIAVKKLKSIESILINWCHNEEEKIGLFNINIEKDKCMECEACMKLCPKQVWTKKEEKLIYAPYKCNGCRICEDVCVGKAIYIDESINKSKEKIYNKIEYTCDNCTNTFFTYLKDKSICSKCAGDRIFKK